MTVSTKTARAPAHAAHRTGTLSPVERDVLWDIEEHFWTSDADNARATTATNAVMIFPYPPGILQGDQIWTHLRQRTGWRSVVMAERRVTRSGDLAILTYRVSAALVRGIRALGFLQSGSSAELRDDGDFLILQFRSGIGSVVGARHIDEGTVVLLIDLVRHYAGPDWLPKCIELPGTARSDATLDASLGAAIRWGASLPGIAIRGDVLRALNPSPRDARTAPVYRDLRAMVRSRPPSSLAEFVRDTLSILAPTGDVSEEAVAKWLGLGRRTLQRHLASEGCRFRDILVAFQMERAATLLEETDHSVEEIAAALGYSEVNSLRRAFRKWTGVTPTEYCARHAAIRSA
ncbi:helix-turn-helix domain-containing protein [Tropicimonas aquimaris]|uniref:Helix-turn-helix domain-containing protein n=1 Tax=Tropicimonas aquimaris TaxID=914152 RepID=A0ABW3ILU2_9RHOB